jgi:beta-N-acetylhexosaminidase
MSFSPMMFDLTGTELTDEEREILQHPIIGGVILFTRNYHSAAQVTELVNDIHKVTGAANKEVLVAVDHEGGRVQRFRSEFTELPAVATLGSLYAENQDEALRVSRLHGWLMASEVKSVGLDFSFSPVLDLNYEISDVIGDRAFHRDASVVTRLAAAYIEGMRDAGMASTGKHFPGHGAIKEDSHLAIPVDQRSREEIFAADIKPFIHLFDEGLDAVMPAHVIYPEIDNLPAGFSRIWLQDILRQQLDFQGVIFSDDLTMEGASVVGGFTERAEAAIEAGCDMILACNNRQGAIEIIDNVKIRPSAESSQRLKRMQGQSIINRSALLESDYWQEAVRDVSMLA